MANMSYCRFQNTSMDFRDCLDAVHEALEDGLSFETFFKSLDSYEQASFKVLLLRAQRFIDLVEELKSDREGTIYDNEMDA